MGQTDHRQQKDQMNQKTIEELKRSNDREGPKTEKGAKGLKGLKELMGPTAPIVMKERVY